MKENEFLEVKTLTMKRKSITALPGKSSKHLKKLTHRHENTPTQMPLLIKLR